MFGSETCILKLIEIFFFILYYNTLNVELNPICHQLALLGAQHIFHVSRIRDNLQMRNYLTKYHTSTCLDTFVSSSESS
jgi:hypothetical protein